MSRRARTEEHGFALIVCVIVLTILMAVGLGVAALADNQHGPARDERSREAAQNLAEAALSAQVFQLSRIPWPGARRPRRRPPAPRPPPRSTRARTRPSSRRPSRRRCRATTTRARRSAWKTWWSTTAAASGPTTSRAARRASPRGIKNKDRDPVRSAAMGVTSSCKTRTVVTQVKANFTTLTSRADVHIGQLAAHHGQEEGRGRQRWQARPAQVRSARPRSRPPPRPPPCRSAARRPSPPA